MRIKNTVKHHSSFQLAEMASQWQGGKGSRETTQHTHRWVGTSLYSQVQHKEPRCPFQAWYWHLKRLPILFCCLWQIQSSDWTLFPTQSIFEQVFSTVPKCDCSFTYYCVSHSCSALHSGRDWPTDWSVAASSQPCHLLDSAGPNPSSTLATKQALISGSQEAPDWTYRHSLASCWSLRSRVKYWRMEWI